MCRAMDEFTPFDWVYRVGLTAHITRYRPLSSGRYRWMARITVCDVIVYETYPLKNMHAAVDDAREWLRNKRESMGLLAPEEQRATLEDVKTLRHEGDLR